MLARLLGKIAISLLTSDVKLPAFVSVQFFIVRRVAPRLDVAGTQVRTLDDFFLLDKRVHNWGDSVRVEAPHLLDPVDSTSTDSYLRDGATNLSMPDRTGLLTSNGTMLPSLMGRVKIPAIPVSKKKTRSPDASDMTPGLSWPQGSPRPPGVGVRSRIVSGRDRQSNRHKTVPIELRGR